MKAELRTPNGSDEASRLWCPLAAARVSTKRAHGSLPVPCGASPVPRVSIAGHQQALQPASIARRPPLQRKLQVKVGLRPWARPFSMRCGPLHDVCSWCSGDEEAWLCDKALPHARPRLSSSGYSRPSAPPRPALPRRCPSACRSLPIVLKRLLRFSTHLATSNERRAAAQPQAQNEGRPHEKCRAFAAPRARGLLVADGRVASSCDTMGCRTKQWRRAPRPPRCVHGRCACCRCFDAFSLQHVCEHSSQMQPH
jgi:hypothetical protein